MNPIMDSLSVPPPPLDSEDIEHAPPKVLVISCNIGRTYSHTLNAICLPHDSGTALIESSKKRKPESRDRV